MARVASRSGRFAAGLATIAIVLTGAGCGSSEDKQDDPGSDSSASDTPTQDATGSPSESPSEDSGAKQIDITFEGDKVTPNGKRIKVGIDEKLELVITADAPGELHVHSSPEQELEYDEGVTTLPLEIEQPGVVDVESHDLEVVIVQLEVS